MNTVLAIEDDEHIGAVLGFILARLGCEVRLIADGAAARDAIASMPPPDLVLLDMLLPRVGGLELLRQIRQLPAWSATPVLMLTASTDAADLGAALRSGATDYLVKPFEPLALMERLRAILAAQGSST